MIKLKCPICNSDKVYYKSNNSFGDAFKCEDCKKEFKFFEAEWEQE